MQVRMLDCYQVSCELAAGGLCVCLCVAVYGALVTFPSSCSSMTSAH